MPEGWHEAAARRISEVDRAEVRANERRAQESRHRTAKLAQAERLQAENRARQTTSVPPPGWQEA